MMSYVTLHILQFCQKHFFVSALLLGFSDVCLTEKWTSLLDIRVLLAEISDWLLRLLERGCVYFLDCESHLPDLRCKSSKWMFKSGYILEM